MLTLGARELPADDRLTARDRRERRLAHGRGVGGDRARGHEVGREVLAGKEIRTEDRARRNVGLRDEHLGGARTHRRFRLTPRGLLGHAVEGDARQHREHEARGEEEPRPRFTKTAHMSPLPSLIREFSLPRFLIRVTERYPPWKMRRTCRCHCRRCCR